MVLKIAYKKVQDTVVLWSKSSTLDRSVEGSNPAAANFSFKVDDLEARRKKEDGNEKQACPQITRSVHWKRRKGA